MSYSINITGHKDTSGPEESKAFEQDVAEKAKALVAELEGVTSASMSASSGTYSLMPTAE